MMNKMLLSQLRLCKKAKIPALTGEELEIVIPRGEIEIPPMVDVGGYYIIELESYIVNPPPTFTLHDNWNRGTKPKVKVMQCVVEKAMGKMILINGIGYDRENQCYIDGTEWKGWLPTKSVSIIRRLG